MADAARALPDILALEDRLVSPLCGVIRELSRVHKDPVEPALPFVWRAVIANHQFSHDKVESTNIASGKGLDHDRARRGALGEAVERYCALRLPGERVRIGPASSLPGPAVDPRALVLYAEDQYPALPYDPYVEGMTLAWVEARGLDGGAVWIPAEAAYFGRVEGMPLLAQATSNGLAAGASRSAAALGALCEVIERDAYIIAWYNRLPARRIDWRGLPDAGVRAVAEAYARRGVAIELYRLPTDHGVPVFIAIGFEDRPGGLAAVAGLGCDLSPAKAAAGAILEVGQVRSPLRQRARLPESLARRDLLVANPSQVAELEDHDLLYTDPRMAGAFAFWRTGADPEEGDWDEPPADVEARLAAVAAALDAIGAKACICDLTTPDIAALGLHVVRAVVEEFQPIHFGETEIRLGGRRLYALPARLGLAAGPTARADLNPLPHPVA